MHLNEDERMGKKTEWRAKTWRKSGVDEQRRVGKNKENGIDYSVTQRQRRQDRRKRE